MRLLAALLGAGSLLSEGFLHQSSARHGRHRFRLLVVSSSGASSSLGLIKVGAMVEYLSPHGSKQLCLVTNTTENKFLGVINEGR